MTRAPGPSGDRGSGTVLVLALVAVVLLLGAGLGVLSAAHGSAGRAQSAADLAALAGAGVLPRQGVAAACEVAGEAAVRNGARLTACEEDGADVLRVTAAVDGVGGQALRQARAGPPSAREAG